MRTYYMLKKNFGLWVSNNLNDDDAYPKREGGMSKLKII